MDRKLQRHMPSGTISSIIPEEEASWAGRSFLTFDIDWAHDEIIADTMALVSAYGQAATWFATHDTPLLNDIRGNKSWELGIHPNFNKLLNGDPSNGANAKEVVERLLEFVPDARSVRSHSMTQNSNLLDLFTGVGLTHDSNTFIPSGVGLPLRPWRIWNHMVRVPYNWEDDVYCLMSDMAPPELDPGVLVRSASVQLKVLDFHPIHVFLNTECLDRYQRTRSLHNDPGQLIRHRFEGYGTRSRLMDVLAALQQNSQVAAHF